MRRFRPLRLTLVDLRHLFFLLAAGCWVSLCRADSLFRSPTRRRCCLMFICPGAFSRVQTVCQNLIFSRLDWNGMALVESEQPQITRLEKINCNHIWKVVSNGQMHDGVTSCTVRLFFSWWRQILHAGTEKWFLQDVPSVTQQWLHVLRMIHFAGIILNARGVGCYSLLGTLPLLQLFFELPRQLSLHWKVEQSEVPRLEKQFHFLKRRNNWAKMKKCVCHSPSWVFSSWSG